MNAATGNPVTTRPIRPADRGRGAASVPGPAVVPGAAGPGQPGTPTPSAGRPDAAKAKAALGPVAVAPVADYDAHYKAHDVTVAQLLLDLDFLKRQKKFGDVELALQAFLKYHGRKAEAWMYEMLAVTVEMNKHGPERVKTALGWAGYLARKERDPVTLERVAALWMTRGIDEVRLPDGKGGASAIRLGELLDLAAELGPHLVEPIAMSLLLAEKARDPKRMADAVEKLDALGWPGRDEVWRAQARQKAEALAKWLKEEGRPDEARTLLARLEDAEARDVYVRLTWKGFAGLDLNVEEPLGAIATPAEPRTVFGGAILKSGLGSKYAESLYVCPRGFSGDYTIRVKPLFNDDKAPVREATLEVILHEGTSAEQKSTHTIDLDNPKPVVVRLDHGRRTQVLPYTAPKALVLPRDEPKKPDSTKGPAKPAK